MRALIDKQGRPITYLRLSVTDRCNLRCTYCLPEMRPDFMPRSHLLTYEEMLVIVNTLVKMGVSKVRITGGEPFVRKDLVFLLEKLTQIKGLNKIAITTNGVATLPFVTQLHELGIHDINLSLDSFNAERFKEITQKDQFHKVMQCLDKMLSLNFNIKINAVVINGLNSSEIGEMAAKTKDLPIEMRFIEEMPFNGNGEIKPLRWNYIRIEEEIRKVHPLFEEMSTPKTETARKFKLPAAKGTIGIIPAYSRTFCGSCNRMRISASGRIRSCLYDKDGADLKSVLRHGGSEDELAQVFYDTFDKRAVDGFAAQERSAFSHLTENMSSIGG